MVYYLAILVIASPAGGFAEELEQDTLLDEIVVTANRTETSKQEVTSTVSVITQEMIRNSPAGSVQELLGTVPGVALYGLGGLGGKNAVSIRGIDGGGSSQKMLLLIDGRPANNGYQGGIDWNLIPLANIERIEVVRGPVSALYGDNSLGGAVNIITKKYDKDRTILETSYGSFQTFTTSLLQQGKLHKGNYVFTSQYGNTDGFRDHSDYEGQNYTLRLNFDTGWTFSGGYMRYDRTNPGTAGIAPPSGPGLDARPDYDSYDFDTAEGYYFDLSKEIKSGVHTTKISTYYNVLNSANIAEDTKSSGTNPNKWTEYLGTYSLSEKIKEKTAGAQFNQNIAISDKQALTWGVDYRYLDAEGYDQKASPKTLTITPAHESAIYVQNTWRIAEKLTMDLGGRYDHHSVYGGQFNPKFGLAYDLEENLTLKLNVARAFKAPTLNDLFGKNGNPDLTPTKAWDYELGMEKRFDERTKASLTIYREDVDGLIIGVKRGGGTQKMNADNMRPQGFELELAQEINEHVGFFTNYTYLDVGDMTRRASRHKGNIGVNYKNGAFKASLYEQYVGSSYVEDLKTDPDAEKIGAYMLTNLKFSYEPKGSDYTYAFAIENVFDRYYENYLYDPMPGRAYTFSVKRKF